MTGVVLEGRPLVGTRTPPLSPPDAEPWRVDVLDRLRHFRSGERAEGAERDVAVER